VKIYPDSCIYGRPNDDQTQPDIEAETLAIYTIFDVCRIAGHIFIGSTHVKDEIMANSNATARNAARDLFEDTVRHCADLTAADIMRAQIFMARGLSRKDSLHLAAAEAADADVLLTVDKDFERVAANNKLSKVRVLNPLKFIKEIIK
jgi:predicted nucleic acid-binding protein